MAAPAKTPRRHARFHSPFSACCFDSFLSSCQALLAWDCGTNASTPERDKTVASERRSMDQKAFDVSIAIMAINDCGFNPMKCFSKRLEKAMLNPYTPAWNSSLKQVLTPMTDITTACGSVMVRFRMLKATTKHKGFGIPPRQDPRRLRSHNRRWDGGAKVSRSSDRIYPPPYNDVGRSNEGLRLLVFKIKIFKDSLCSVFRLL